jgi:hypothetical protein
VMRRDGEGKKERELSDTSVPWYPHKRITC